MKYPNTRPEDYETVDNTPVEIPTRLRLPQSRTDQMRQFIRFELSRQSAEQGFETFEEADDVEPDDEDHLPYTKYEIQALEPVASEPTFPLQNGVKAEGQPPADPAATLQGKSPVPSEDPANGS